MPPPLDLPASMPGHSLPQAYYNDPRIFERDLDRMLLRHWFCAGHSSSLPRAGDYFLADLGPESVILCRDRIGTIHGLINVCRHRGSRVCVSPSGNAAGGRLTCPYHAWSYALDGSLLAAREMPSGFDRGSAALGKVHVQVIEGLIFVCLADWAPALDDASVALTSAAGFHGWAAAKVAHRETFPIRANWKLAVENYLECYHCQPAHAEYSRRHLYARPEAEREGLERRADARSEACGIRIENQDTLGPKARPGQESASVLRSALLDGYLTGSADGRALAPLMGKFREYDGNTTFFDVGPISHFLAYPDHGLMYRFIPRRVDFTELEVVWLVDAGAVEGRDYDLERLTWLWRVTSVEDTQIIERNQDGVNSRFYRPGVYSTQENSTARFIEWYLAEVG